MDTSILASLRLAVLATHMPQPPPLPQRRDWKSNAAALLKFGSGDRPENYWTINDAFQGTQVFGSTGSGKSSGSGEAIARAFIANNFGGLVMTAKTDERATWERYFAESDRPLSDLIIFGADSDRRFNFLTYEKETAAGGDSQTENLVNLFCSVIEVADRRSSSGNSDSYWTRALKQLLRNAIDLLMIALDEVTLPRLYQVITSAPASLDEATSPDWMKDSNCYAAIQLARARAPEIGKTEDLEITEDFWLREYPMLAPETRSGFVSMFTTIADCFLRGTLRKLFCTDLNFRPEDCFEGKVILLDLPVKLHHELGIFAQVLFKYIWQRAVERRIPIGLTREQIEEQVRPVFLWADESQFFVNQYDALFQSTARSSRACTVYLTQNLPSYRNALGGSAGGSAAEAFLGNLQTKIFHANGDPKTNEWAASSIGRTRQIQVQSGMSVGEQNRGSSQNSGSSFAFEFLVQPQEFTELRTGGVENDFVVDSIIFQGGRRWIKEVRGKAEPVNFIRHSFSQK